MINAQHISKTYTTGKSTVTALDGLSITCAPGEFLAVKGPSGCGKTSLLLTIGGLLRPDSGSLDILGRNPYDLSPEARAAFRGENIGFVFQQFYLVPYLTVRENILAPSITHPSPEAETYAGELISRFSLQERAHHVPARLSVGERQRVAMARALLNKPSLLLADEPTGNLDEENGAIVIEALNEFARNGGAVLLVTHDTAAAASADRVLYMKKGRIIDPVQP